jgi:hypothetical protein
VARDIAGFTTLLQWLGKGGIGIFCQKNTSCGTFFQGFPELFCSNDHPFAGKFRQIPVLGDSTIISCIHTR